MTFDKNSMRAVAERIQQAASRAGKRAVVFYTGQVKTRVGRLGALVRAGIVDYPDKRERTRRVILLFAFLFFFDYLMYCLHTDKNVVDIFPEITPLEQGKKVNVYLPDLDGVSILTERRWIPAYDSDEKTARALFEIVVKGSIFDNTSMAVPGGLFLRKVWIHGKPKGKDRACIFDLEPVELGVKAAVVQNSEALFRRALEKTVRENLPSIQSVVLLEKGVPGTPLWEL